MAKFFTNGILDDEFGTGVTISSLPSDSKDNPIPLLVNNNKSSLGYLAKEVTEKEYLLWQSRIANPDMVEYFPGIFPGIGVVNREIYDKLQAQRKEQVRLAATVSKRQALLALHSVGLSPDAIREKIKAMDNGEALLIEFDYATEFKRSHPAIAGIAAVLGLSDSAVDELFAKAAAL